MGFQCLPQVLKLVRGDGMRRDGKGKSKLQANAAAITNEAHPIKDPEDGHPIPIRKSASETYDRTRTKYNKYVGPVTADDVLEALDEEAAKQKVEVRVKDKQTGEIVVHQRSLPSNAVIGLAVIYNPPCDVARNWTPEQYARFIQDCEEVMAQIPCRKMDKKGHPVGEPYYLFRQENRVARAEHWDESEPGDPPIYTGHWHETYTPADQYGKYNGNMVDSLFLSVMVNRMFPQMMRERGWDIDDPECTDWEKFNDDKTYRAKRKSKIRQGGKSVNNYRADKKLAEADAQVEAAAAMAEKAAELVEAAETAALQAEADAAEIRSNAEAEAEQIREDVQAEIDQKREFAQMGLDVAIGARESAQQQLDELKRQADTARKIINDADAARAEKERLEQEINDLKSEATRIEDIMIADGEAAGNAAAQQEWDRIVDDANQEADRIKDDMIKQGKAAGRDAAKAEQARIIAEAKQEMADWKVQIKEKTEAKAKQIIEDAKRAASGLAAFVMDWFDKEPFVYHDGRFEGRTYLDVATEFYTQQVRQARLNDHSTGTMTAAEAGRNQRTRDGRDVMDD